MTSLELLLSSFTPVGLDDLNKVSLMDRMDSKYGFQFERLNQIFPLIQPHYKVLEIKKLRVFKYESLYYDTNELKYYHMHQCGKANRLKIRYRRYVDSDLSFFEVKAKNNKSRTLKDRISVPMSYELKSEEMKLLQTSSFYHNEKLIPVIGIDFNRVTLVNNELTERVTIDTDLKFYFNGKERQLSNVVIAEVKQEKSSRSEFKNLMKKLHIHEGTISKYCFGISSLFPNNKHNNFKESLIKFNKIEYGIAAGY